VDDAASIGYLYLALVGGVDNSGVFALEWEHELYPWHMIWLPVVAMAAPSLCAYCFHQLESTVAEARALRGHMYDHKRA